MKCFKQLSECRKNIEKDKLPLQVSLHVRNEKIENRDITDVMHASLEYGMPGVDANAIGGVGSFVYSLTKVQKEDPKLNVRVITPAYGNLPRTAKLVKTVQHYYNDRLVATQIWRYKNSNGINQYLVKPDDDVCKKMFDIPASFTYSDCGDSKFIERICYFNGAVAAFAMEGDDKDSSEKQQFFPHIVQGHAWGLYFLGALIEKYRNLYGFGPKTVCTVHSSHHGDGFYSSMPDIGLYNNSSIHVTKMIGEGYDHIVYVSEQLLKESLLDNSGFAGVIKRLYLDKKVSAILNNIFADQFDPSIYLPKQYNFNLSNITASKLKLKQELNTENKLGQFNKVINLDKPLVLYLGRISPEKGIDKLEEAIEEVVVRQGASFIVMGIGGGDVLDKIKDKYKNNKNVIILDKFEHQVKYGDLIRAAADIYFVPSKLEACGLVPMEANLAGAVVISSDACGLRNVIIPDANGTIFYNSVVGDSAEKIRMIFKGIQSLKESGNLDKALELIQSSARYSFDWNSPTSGSARLYRELYDSIYSFDKLADKANQLETGVTHAIIENDIGSLERELNSDNNAIKRPNKLGISPEEMTKLCVKPDLLNKNKILLNVCYEYGQVKLGGVGEVTTALTNIINKKTEETSIEARVITPHYPLHDKLIDKGELSNPVILGEVEHLYLGKKIFSTITMVENKGVKQYLVRVSPFQLDFQDENELFGDIDSNEKIKNIFNNITPKVAYFNSAVAAFIKSCNDDGKFAKPIDIVNCHSWGAGILSYLLKGNGSSNANIPKCILTIHSEPSEQGVVPVGHQHMRHLAGIGMPLFTADENFSPLKEGIRYSDQIVYVSADLEKQFLMHKTKFFSLKDTCKHAKNKSSVIFNNITDAFDPEKLNLIKGDNIINAKQNAKKQINDKLSSCFSKVDFFDNKKINVNEPLVLFVGRFLEEKGVDMLDAAIELVLKKNPNANFIVMGLHGGQKEDRIIIDIQTKYKRKENVIVINEDSPNVQKTLGGLLRFASDFTFIPSHRESCGLVAMESLLNSSIPISSNVGGLNDTVVDGVGFKYDDENKSKLISMKKAIEKSFDFLSSLKKSPENYNQFLLSLFDKATSNYVWGGEKSSDSKYFLLFNRLLQSKKLDEFLINNGFKLDDINAFNHLGYTPLTLLLSQMAGEDGFENQEMLVCLMDYKDLDLKKSTKFNFPPEYYASKNTELMEYFQFIKSFKDVDIEKENLSSGVSNNHNVSSETSRIEDVKKAFKESFFVDISLLCSCDCSEVYTAINKNNNQQVIIKLITNQLILQNEVENEILVLKILEKYLDSKNIGEYKAIVMPKDEGITLEEYFIKNPNVCQSERIKIILGIIQEIKELHDKKIIHQDISPTNILYDYKSGKINIIDFGWSKKTNNKGVHHGLYRGFRFFTAPECNLSSDADKNIAITQAVDLYALGETIKYIMGNHQVRRLRAIQPTSLNVSWVNQIVSSLTSKNVNIRELQYESILRLKIFFEENGFNLLNINGFNKFGHTPLTHLLNKLSNNNDFENQQLLISLMQHDDLDLEKNTQYNLAPEYFANKNQQTKDLFTVLSYLKKNDFSTSLEGINESHQTSLHTPLTLAASLNDKKICELLIKHGAKPEQSNALGNTAVHNAIDTENIELVEYLLRVSKGKEMLQMFNIFKKTPLMLANENSLTNSSINKEFHKKLQQMSI